jgi:DNA-damage-inducible protein D
MSVLGVQNQRKIGDAVNRAKVAAGKADLTISEHFSDGTLFEDPGNVYLSKYAAYLVVMSCDPSEGLVGRAQVYFALQVDRQQLEDEKRLRTRLDVATEQNKLHGVAKDKGVIDFQKFNGMGIQGLYGGRSAADVKAMKGLPAKVNHLDHAGSEELAANLFRITQTRAALARQGHRSETLACITHKQVGQRIRQAIIDAGNTPPEQLPACSLKIDKLATETKKKITGK